MENIYGYLGLFQPPLNGQKSSIYCVCTPDCRNLVMIPLVSNFFETAYSVARDPKYQRVFIVLPTMDMQMISDAYLFYYEVGVLLNKQVEFFCGIKPQIPVTDDFYSHVHVKNEDEKFQLMDYFVDDSYFDIVLEFRNKNWSPYKPISDIYISTNGLRILFCPFMSKAKYDGLVESQVLDTIDQIHVPFMKNMCGGLNYLDCRKSFSPRYLSKLYAYGFASIQEANLCSTIGKIGEVKYYDFV